MNSLNKRVCFLATFLGLMIVLTSCSLGLAKKTGTPEVKKSNFATTTEKISTTTEGRIASSTDDMSNWKTYSNKIIGIEFKYPPTWPTLTKDNVGDNEEDEKNGQSFYLSLVDLSWVGRWVSKYDNLSVEEQIKKIEGEICDSNSKIVKCENKTSLYGVKYIWEKEKNPSYEGYLALVATGKYVLLFNFQEPENYNKRADEYQKLLSTLKITNK